jgi:hypothetical protein
VGLRRVASQTLDAGLRQRLQQNIDALLDVIASLNLLGVAFDAFREVYQNVSAAGGEEERRRVLHERQARRRDSRRGGARR